MNRRSILRLLGLAPIAAPAALVAASKPGGPSEDCIRAASARITLGESRIFGPAFMELMPDGSSRFVTHGTCFVASEANTRAAADADQTRLISALQASHADVERLRLALSA